MKIINILGGLGNQMFQYALAIALREQYKSEEVFIDISNFKGYSLHNNYELNKLFPISIPTASISQIIKTNIPYFNYNLWRVGSRLFRFLPSYITEKKYRKKFINNQSSKIPSNAYFDGYWQSENYFKKHRDTILKEFTFSKIDEDENLKLLPSVKNKNSVSIHIRRGDYVNHPLFKDICTIKYYQNAIDKIKSLTKVDNFIIFSNDIEWCKENFKDEFGNIEVIFVNWNKGDKSFRDMQLMSLCKHNIIANSSFSWWGAWLNQNPNKIVIAPFKWNNRECDPQNYIASDWCKIEDI